MYHMLISALPSIAPRLDKLRNGTMQVRSAAWGISSGYLLRGWILSNINKGWGRMGKGAFTLPTFANLRFPILSGSWNLTTWMLCSSTRLLHAPAISLHKDLRDQLTSCQAKMLHQPLPLWNTSTVCTKITGSLFQTRRFSQNTAKVLFP